MVSQLRMSHKNLFQNLSPQVIPWVQIQPTHNLTKYNFQELNKTKKLLEVNLKKLFYRIFIKEGKTNVIIYDWTKTDVTNENSFFLDTSYMIPREYFMEFKAKTYTEEIFYNDYVKFEILSEK